VNLRAKIEEIAAHIESARAMPMSASCIVNRGQLLGLLDEVRDLIPAEVTRAETLLHERDDVVADGQREAERIIAAAHAERERMLSETEVHQAAAAAAAQVREEAAAEARQMRQEVDDYVDTKLANFEIVLNKTLAAVLRGRDKLHGRQEIDQLADQIDDAPLPGA
jgi:hypothetical protein